MDSNTTNGETKIIEYILEINTKETYELEILANPILNFDL